MKLFGILDPFFHALSDGKMIRSVVSIALRVFAVIAMLGGVVWGIMTAGAALTVRNPGAILGSLLFGALWLVLGFVQCGILLYRARTITELGDSQFTVTSIVSVFCRLIGEELFVFFLLLGIGGFFYEALTNSDPLGRLGAIGSFVPNVGGGLMGGVVLLAAMAAIAFLSIVIFYAMAELTVVLVDIARNMNLVRLALAPQPAMAMAASASAACAPPARSQATGHCRSCGSSLDPGTAYCGVCGAAAQG